MSKNLNNNPKILVALSGGVDSAVTALLLLEQGFAVRGIHFLLNDAKDSEASASTLKRAQKVAEKLGIELEVRDIRKDFQRQVIDDFAQAYKSGRTPNPCVICNRRVKFKQLLKAREELDCDLVATGHYAKIQGNQLYRARDPRKDQSYFLYRLAQKQLQFCRFPLGEYSKDWVKQRGAELSLGLEKQGESQDICFFEPGQTLRDFLGNYSKKELTSAQIISDQGEKLGQCEALELLTVGQRKGLNLSGGPWYVLERDFAKRQLVVTRDSEYPDFWQEEIVIEWVNWINQPPDPGRWYDLQIRYQGRVYRGKFEVVPDSEAWKVILKEPARAVARGQSLVVYEEGKILGGGVIC
jgi:tRNA-specific 2-thiouridylase